MESLVTFIDFFFVKDSRAEVLFFVGLFAGASLIFGAIFRRNYAEALLMGLLVLIGAANISVFVFRSLELDLTYFGWFVLLLGVALACAFRTVLERPDRFSFRIKPSGVLVFGALAAAIWFSQILTTEPSAGMSSHQAWYPLYLTESFARERFLTHADMRFAPGFMASLLFNVDLLGLAALGTWFDAGAGYTPFLAAAIVCGMACAGIFAWGLRKNWLACLGGAIFFLIYFRYDPDFRLIVGSNWGDVVMYLSGMATLYYIMSDPQRPDRWLLVALAALFLPFGRSFGVAYAGLLCAYALIQHWRQNGELNWRAWGLVFILGCMFSAREVYLLLASASPYYETVRYLFDYKINPLDTIRHNIGIDLTPTRPAWLKVLYAAPLLVAGMAIILKAWRPKCVALTIRQILEPFILFLLPALLVLMTGSYGGEHYNKVFTVALFLHVYYMWRVAAVMDVGVSLIDRALVRKRKILLGAVAAAVILTIPLVDRIRSHRLVRDGVGEALSWAFETYRSNNADLVMARALRERPRLLTCAINHPILYLHYEPGLTLRYFIGGSLFMDLDYWSEEVFDIVEQNDSFNETVRRLGDPLIYIAYGKGLLYGGYVRGDVWNKFADEIETLDSASWITEKVEAVGARLYIPAGALTFPYCTNPQ